MIRLILLLSFSFILYSCTGGEKPGVAIESKLAVTSTSQVTPIKTSTYEQDLKSVSTKIKDSEEFKSCMDMNVPMCIQSSVMQIAQKSKSTEFCNELSTPEQKEGCVFAVTITQVQETKDKKLCDSLSERYKDQCISTIVRAEAIEKNDTKICLSLTKPTSTGNTMMMENNPADECIMNVIMSTTTSTKDTCESIQSKRIKDTCIQMIKQQAEMRNSQINPTNPMNPTNQTNLPQN